MSDVIKNIIMCLLHNKNKPTIVGMKYHNEKMYIHQQPAFTMHWDRALEIWLLLSSLSTQSDISEGSKKKAKTKKKPEQKNIIDNPYFNTVRFSTTSAAHNNSQQQQHQSPSDHGDIMMFYRKKMGFKGAFNAECIEFIYSTSWMSVN